MLVLFRISPLDNAQQNITKIRKLINGEDVEADSGYFLFSKVKHFSSLALNITSEMNRNYLSFA